MQQSTSAESLQLAYSNQQKPQDIQIEIYPISLSQQSNDNKSYLCQGNNENFHENKQQKQSQSPNSELQEDDDKGEEDKNDDNQEEHKKRDGQVEDEGEEDYEGSKSEQLQRKLQYSFDNKIKPSKTGSNSQGKAIDKFGCSNKSKVSKLKKLSALQAPSNSNATPKLQGLKEPTEKLIEILKQERKVAQKELLEARKDANQATSQFKKNVDIYYQALNQHSANSPRVLIAKAMFQRSEQLLKNCEKTKEVTLKTIDIINNQLLQLTKRPK